MNDAKIVDVTLSKGCHRLNWTVKELRLRPTIAYYVKLKINRSFSIVDDWSL
jgi:hypothetical protein